jgi:four helix bundle protein
LQAAVADQWSGNAEIGHFRIDFVPHFVPPFVDSGRLGQVSTGPGMFSIEKLKVYDRAMASVARLSQLSACWDKRHAVVDQLVRASESVVLNIAEGVRLRGTANRQHVLDYAIGSALECAACLDIAVLRNLSGAVRAHGRSRSGAEAVWNRAAGSCCSEGARIVSRQLLNGSVQAIRTEL